MNTQDIQFPKEVKISKRWLTINLENPFKNIISIDKTDYYPYYLDNSRPGNRGGNSFVIKLVAAQEYDEDEGYPEIPDLVMKICKFRVWIQGEHKKSERFNREISALLDCYQHNLQNLVEVKDYGKIDIDTDGTSASYRYYTMDYADSDMLTHVTANYLTLYNKISLCIELCESLKQLWSRGYYHRDIKPENILFINGNWTISDLGLVAHRDRDSKIDTGEKWIGPRGWMSPESMNKYLTESTQFEDLFDCKIDHQSDIYQLGKVLWFILQGNSPEGGIRRNDFILSNDGIYQIVRTMINNSKKSRFKEIDEVLLCLKRILTKMVKSGQEFSLVS